MLRKLILKYILDDFWKESGSGGKNGVFFFICLILCREFRFIFIFVDLILLRM